MKLNHLVMSIAVMTGIMISITISILPGCAADVLSNSSLDAPLNASSVAPSDASLDAPLNASSVAPSDASLGAPLNAPLERGIKGEQYDAILMGADDWRAVVAATPLSIWSDDNRTEVVPMLMLPRAVRAGERTGWVEESELLRYGAPAILSTLKSANISAITIHGSGDLVKALVEAAQKDGLKAYVTATLDVPVESDSTGSGDIEKLSEAADSMLSEAGLDQPGADESTIDRSLLQVPDPETGGNATRYCPSNPKAREVLYNQIEALVDDYHVDGVVLYDIGYEDESFCYCNVCKERFLQDTGIDQSKIKSDSYNRERWMQWRQEQVMQIVEYARNITDDLGPVNLGLALDNPFDRTHGYNFVEISKTVDFSIISPLSASDVGLAVQQSTASVYVKLSEDYLAHVLSTRNVKGAIDYIESVTDSGAYGLSFEYDVVHTPVWAELQPPSNAARWLLGEIGGRYLAIGDVSWNCEERLLANNSFELAERISRHWLSSPGVVITGDDYGRALFASTIASYLNWPILYANESLPEETASALLALGAREAVLVGPVPAAVEQNLSLMNITCMKGDEAFLVNQMRLRGDDPKVVVYLNSHDLSLLAPAAKTVVKRSLIDDLLVRTEMSPSEVPSEELEEIVRVNFTLSNTGDEELRDVRLLDVFPMGRLIKWPRPQLGSANITDPYSGVPSDAMNSFINGTMLRWNIKRLSAGSSASLNIEVELLYPMDSGWEERLDYGATAAFEGFSYNHTIMNVDEPPVVNLTYPTWIYSGLTNISWNLDREASYTTLNIYSPDKRSGSLKITDIAPDSLYDVRAQMRTPGLWKFNIEVGDGFRTRTKNYSIEVLSNTEGLNITSFGHTKVPGLSMVAPAAAAARKGLLIDAAVDPQNLDPEKEEEKLQQRVEELKIDPDYMMVVGDPGSLPFIPTGLKQKVTDIMEYEVHRDYQLPMNEENYSTVAVGRIIGLSVYDASQLLARTFAYDRLNGSWKNEALLISSPPLSFPQAPTSASIREYLSEAGLQVRDLRYEDATFQQVISQMNNGKGIVSFDHHGNEHVWQLSDWSMMDEVLTGSHVNELTLAPQMTTSAACVTANLKGYYLNVTGTRIYVPLDMEDSIALSFIHAGAVSYVGYTALSWIFIADDFPKRFYQSLVFENSTVGEAALDANNLFRLKCRASESLKDVSEYDESLPGWDLSISEMLNQTAYMDSIIGDPSLRPHMPQVPALPYEERVEAINATNANTSAVRDTIDPNNESATDWIYWIETDSKSGDLDLNAPPAIVARVLLPTDADKIVVKENGLSLWHDEMATREGRVVMWPVIRPKLGEERSFSVEYAIVPGVVQRINITAGWNAVAVYLKPKEASISKHLANKPYRSIFTIDGDGWDFSMKDSGLVNVTRLEPGEGLLIDSADNFTMEISGKPVDLPVRLEMHSGWNMIGLPLNRSASLSEITVNSGHKRYGYQEAVDRGLVSAFVWKYENSEWTHLGENETLVPGRAYLFEAMDEAKLEFR